MERKDILAKLKAKYSNLGYSQADMEAFAETVEKQTEGNTDEQIEEAIDKMEPYLKTFQKMADKLRSEKSAAEKKATDKNKAEGAPTEKGKQTEGEDKENFMKEELEKLRKEIEQMKGDKIQSTRKANLDKQIENLPDSYKKAYSHINLKDLTDEEYDNLLSQIAEETKDVSKEASNSKRAVFGTPFAGNRNNHDKISDKEVDEIVSQMKV